MLARGGKCLFFICVGLSALLSGCKSTTVIDEYREQAVTTLGDNESIVILGRRSSTSHETEIDFIDCVGKSLSSGDKNIHVIPEKDFVDSMYPYFETSTAPMDVKNLDKLVQIPEVANKFSEFGIKYFIWIDGFTETVDQNGSISCAIGPGGGGCFGFASWEDEANYEATIWDFKDLTLSGRISAETNGTSLMPAIFIPIPLLARVQSHACQNLAHQIESFLQ